MAQDPEPLLYRQLMSIRPGNMTANQWLIAAGVNRSFFTDLKRRGRARIDTLEKVIQAAGLTPGEFYARTPPDATPDAIAQERAAADLPFRRHDELRDIPLLGTALGSDFEVGGEGDVHFSEVTDVHLNDVVDYVRRPPALRERREVYALNVVGSSMSPRFDPGDLVYVDPRATPRIGDDVVVYLLRPEGDGEQVFSVLVKRLVRRTASFVELEQFTPAAVFSVSNRGTAQVHRVIPWRELASF